MVETYSAWNCFICRVCACNESLLIWQPWRDFIRNYLISLIFQAHKKFNEKIYAKNFLIARRRSKERGFELFISHILERIFGDGNLNDKCRKSALTSVEETYKINLKIHPLLQLKPNVLKFSWNKFRNVRLTLKN